MLPLNEVEDLTCDEFMRSKEDIEELQKTIKLFRESLLCDRDCASMFLGKVKEFRDELKILEQGYEEFLRWRASYPDKTEWDTYQFNWCRNNRLQQINALKKKLKLFTFYYAKCRGKANDQELNIEAARTFPVGDLIAYEPIMNTARMATFRCPLHQEKSGSFQWYKEKNTWWCFGCHNGRDVIDLFMKLHASTFPEAVKSLAH